LSNELKDVLFVVKLHAKDDRGYYERASQSIGSSRLLVIPHGASGYPRDIFEWLIGCPLVLTGASTVAMEALYVDVPVVTVDYCGETRGVGFIDAGATTHVTSHEALAAAVCKLLADRRPSEEVQGRTETYLQRAFFARDGASARRIADEVKVMMASGEVREVKAPR
jgi:hypothetical protein